MNENPRVLHDAHFELLVEEAASHPLDDDKTALRMKNLKLFSESRPPMIATPPEPPSVPTTKMGRAMAATARVLDNETTRVFIKSGLAAASVLGVVFSTVHRDHVLQREALAQANHRPD